METSVFVADGNALSQLEVEFGAEVLGGTGEGGVALVSREGGTVGVGGGGFEEGGGVLGLGGLWIWGDFSGRGGWGAETNTTSQYIQHFQLLTICGGPLVVVA